MGALGKSRAYGRPANPLQSSMISSREVFFSKATNTAAMWPSVALIVEEKKLGTAYGLMTMIQNIGLTTFNVLVGWANDTSAVNGITDYSLGMWFFSITGFVGLTFAYLLRRQETGTYKSGLEMGHEELHKFRPEI